MKKWIMLSMSILLMSFMISGCSSSQVDSDQMESESTQITFVDDLGRTVTVNRPQRVATLISSFADIWYLAGGVNQIVATTNATWTY